MAYMSDANGIYLFAVNSGELYKFHKAAGERAMPEPEWISHVLLRVEKLYRRQVDASARFTPKAIGEAARFLKAYYERHAFENRRHAQSHG